MERDYRNILGDLQEEQQDPLPIEIVPICRCLTCGDVGLGIPDCGSKYKVLGTIISIKL